MASVQGSGELATPPIVPAGSSAASPIPLDGEAFPPPRQAWYAVGVLTLGMSGPMLNAVMLAITPNQVRGQVMTLYLFIYTVVAVGLAPVITGLTTDYV